MNKCLVTKYDGTVSDIGFAKVGEIAIKQTALKKSSSVDQAITIQNTNKCKVRIEGDAYFTDDTLLQDLGKEQTIPANETTTLYISNNDCTIYISEKYTLSTLLFGLNITGTSSKENNKTFDIAVLKNSPNLVNLILPEVVGDIGNLSNTKNLNYMLLSKYIYGDISAIKNNVNMAYLFIPINVEGDYSALKNMSMLRSFYNTNGKVSGDIASLSGCTKLSSFILSSHCTGDISSLKNLNMLKSFNVFDSSLTGDIAVLSDSLVEIQQARNCNFTWSTRKSAANIISIFNGSPKIDNIDKMLQDQANCVVPSSVSEKVINVKGTRTSASDAAVATLQSKGYTVSITPA